MRTNLRQIAPAERNRLIGLALEMRALGMQVQEIADELGVDRRSVTYWVNPESREKTKERARVKTRTARNEARRREREHMGNFNVGHVVTTKGGPSEADYQARLQEMPQQDTRSVTGRTFGDPVFERSALGKPHT